MSSYITSFSETLQARGFKWYTYGEFLYMYSSYVWPKIFCQHFYMILLTRVAADQVLIDNSKEIPFTRCTPLTLTIIPISFHILTTHILHFYGLIYLISWETAYLKNWVLQTHVEHLHIYSYDITIFIIKNDNICAFYSVDIWICTLDSLLKCDDDINSRIILLNTLATLGNRLYFSTMFLTLKTIISFVNVNIKPDRTSH